MMQINQITPMEDNGEIKGLKVYFSGNIAGINLNGNIPFDNGEFEEFFQGSEMKTAVKQKVIEKIMNGEAPAE
ncbi:hypothetical protein J14TS2_45150 [Bacillus sp. J14TS2]|uniref:hypothetical protein n=1 Tax=Bacillus sp. J14TS2 TaxID=2807188 RepID=UPI001B1B4077|nr:hypothetical protein [Bacillus sp. J14TS2]GIN74040.1 hypothetical protein J14TS2_45150 [Bacillus sp. J14TS2]